MSSSRQRAGRRRRPMVAAALPSAPAAESRAMLQSARLKAAKPYVLRWRPAVVSALALFILLVELLNGNAQTIEATIPMLVAALLSVCAAIAVRLGVSPIDAALVLTFSDLPIIAAWAMASEQTGERLATLLATLLIAAWLFGPFPTAVLGVGSVLTILFVWVLHDPWSLQPIPDALWIVTAGAVLSIFISREIERTMLGAAKQVTTTRDEVQALAGMRDRLAADVSHELRTPLTAINGFIDTLLREDIDVDSELAHQLLEQARQGGERLERLITNLLDVERVTVGSLRLTRKPYRIGPMIDAAIAAVDTANRRIDVTFDRTLGASGEVVVDHRRFVQVVSYLLENAIEHGAGAVTIRCGRRLDELMVDVCDQGTGVAPEHEEYIFEPFISFGAHTGSSGIGLSLARSLAVAHGGRLEYHPGSGDSSHMFRLRIPAWNVTDD